MLQCLWLMVCIKKYIMQGEQPLFIYCKKINQILKDAPLKISKISMKNRKPIILSIFWKLVLCN